MKKPDQPITVKEIVTNYLKENDYDGLTCDSCACDLSFLMPCGEDESACEPGYKVKCDCGEHDYHISTVKPGKRMK